MFSNSRLYSHSLFRILINGMNDQQGRTAPNFDFIPRTLSRSDILPAVLIGIVALILYIRTLAPSLLWGDSAEFQTLSHTLGMTHPSGYMTQIMIGKLFTLIPVGNIAYRVNLMSAFFGALAVAQVCLIVRLLGGLRIAGVSAALMLAIFPLFWWRALIAESYAPAAGMITTVWLLFLLWRRTHKWGYLFLAGLAGGLSVGIHSTVVMTAASVLVIMLFTARRRTDWLGAAGGALLGIILTFSFFLYLDHNDPPSSIYNTVYRTNLSTISLSAGDFDTPLKRLLAIFPAGHFWSYYFTAGSEEVNRRLTEYLAFHPLWAVILVLIGAVTLLIRNWRDGLYPWIAFLIVWGFGVTVSFSVYREFYTPAAIFIFVWYGLGASVLLEWTGVLFKQNQKMVGASRIALGILLIILPVLNSRADLNLAVKSGYTTFVQREHLYPIFSPNKAIRDATKVVDRVEDDAIVFADWDKLYSYVYTAQIENDRTGISFHEAWIGDEQKLSESTVIYIDANIDLRPIYFAITMPGVAERYQVQKINDTLYRIYRK